MIRFIGVVTFLVLYLILTIPVLCVEWLIGKKFHYAADISQLRMVQWLFRCLFAITGSTLTVIGEENVPKDKAVLYVGNHRSYFDIVVTYARCPRLTGYVAKDSLLKVPLFSHWMKRLYCQFLNRDDVKQGLKVILAGVANIKAGISMCIFPEGTRGSGADETEMLPFKEGSLKMAEKTGCPIIPMALIGTADIWEKHFPTVKPAHIILQYGEPIYPKELSKEDQKHLGHYTQEKILELLKQAKLPQS